jgi:ankyrin repeat protein
VWQLLGAGADPYITDVNGRAPLDFAQMKGYDEVIAALDAHNPFVL